MNPVTKWRNIKWFYSPVNLKVKVKNINKRKIAILSEISFSKLVRLDALEKFFQVHSLQWFRLCNQMTWHILDHFTDPWTISRQNFRPVQKRNFSKSAGLFNRLCLYGFTSMIAFGASFLQVPQFTDYIWYWRYDIYSLYHMAHIKWVTHYWTVNFVLNVTFFDLHLGMFSSLSVWYWVSTAEMIQRQSKMTQLILSLHRELSLNDSCSMTHVLWPPKACKQACW